LEVYTFILLDHIVGYVREWSISSSQYFKNGVFQIPSVHFDFVFFFVGSPNSEIII